MLRLRSFLSVLIALILLGGVMTLPARIAVPRNAGLQHRPVDSPPSLLVAFDGDDDDVGSGYEPPALLPAAAIHDIDGISSLASTRSSWRIKTIPIADRRASTLVGTIVLVI